MKNLQSGFAYIFDFDGVLVNTMELHFEAYARACREFGISVEKRRFFDQAGMTGREQIRFFAERSGVDVEVEDVYRRKNELAADWTDRATDIRCNIALLNVLRSTGVKVAIATGSTRRSILPIMEKFDIEVDAVVTSEDVERGKPNPDLFLEAAAQLGASPERCVVVEDSDTGIEAAHKAGMHAFRFYDRDSKE
jgi:HAD superfamily hydrolase (TIGR01509 family)